MESNLPLSGIEAARAMAAMSPETQESFDRLNLLGYRKGPAMYVAFSAIGAALSRKRRPVRAENMRRIFDYAEHLLCRGPGETSNAVATSMLEAIWYSTHHSGFDFSNVDPFLGREARRYLVAWDDFNKVTTPGLTRK